MTNQEAVKVLFDALKPLYASLKLSKDGIQPPVKSLTINLGELITNPKLFAIPFNCVAVRDATDGNCFVKLRFSDQDPSQDYVVMKKGQKLNFQDFAIAQVFIDFPQQAGKSITLDFFFGADFESNITQSISNILDGTSISQVSPVTVTNTATLIFNINLNRGSITILNNGSEIVYIGDATVTTSTGMPVQPSEKITLHNTGSLYGITATGTSEIRIIEEVL